MMSRRKKMVLTICLLLAVIAGTGVWLARELRIDSCLDGGGRWDYAGGKCEGGRE